MARALLAVFPAGVVGDGLLAFVLFAYLSGQENGDPAFRIDDVTVQQAVPEPTTIALLAAGMLFLAARRAMQVKPSNTV